MFDCDAIVVSIIYTWQVETCMWWLGRVHTHNQKTKKYQTHKTLFYQSLNCSFEIVGACEAIGLYNAIFTSYIKHFIWMDWIDVRIFKSEQ